MEAMKKSTKFNLSDWDPRALERFTKKLFARLVDQCLEYGVLFVSFLKKLLFRTEF